MQREIFKLYESDRNGARRTDPRGKIKILVFKHKKYKYKNNIFEQKLPKHIEFTLYYLSLQTEILKIGQSKNIGVLKLRVRLHCGTETPALFYYPDGDKICFEDLEQNYESKSYIQNFFQGFPFQSSIFYYGKKKNGTKAAAE